MRIKILLLTCLLLLGVSQAFGATDLYVDGTLISPVAGPDQDVFLVPSYCPSGMWQFDLLYEETDASDRNSFGLYSDLLYDGGSGLDKTYIFDQRGALDVPVGTSTIVDLSAETGYMGMFLFNDLNDNGIFDGTDAMLFSERGLTIPNPPGSDYQWFMTYNVNTFGYSHFEFNGLDFWGEYDVLIFIDDDHVTSPNYDHNDMVIAGSCAPIPEPTTLLLLGLGLVGAGVIRRRKK